MKKGVQYLSDEALENAKDAKPDDIIQFIEDFRELQWQAMQGKSSKSKLISLKVPEDLLSAFKFKAENQGTRYQTQIKKLMEEWLKR